MNLYWNTLEGSLVSLLITSLAVFFYYFYKNQSSPPGPWGLPYLGYWPFLQSKNLHIQLEKMMKYYGEVYSFRVTGRLFIHLGSIKAIKEAHIKNADSFKRRCKGFTLLNYVFKDSFLCQSGEPWKEQQRFFVNIFKDWGVNIYKNSMSDPITETMEDIVEIIRDKEGEVMNIADLLTKHYSRMFHYLLFGNEALNPELIEAITNTFKNVQTRLQGLSQFLTGNFSKYIILPLTPGNRTFVKDSKFSPSVLKEAIQRHNQTFDRNNIRNSIDKYLKERFDRQEKGDITAEYFTDEVLIYSLTQITGDSVLDISLFLGYLLKALIIYPEEQVKIFEELMEVVGPSRPPTLEDKNQLPYTKAFIWEVTRISDFFPLSVSLECTRETVINGHRIPKGSVTVLNMWAAQHDEQVYTDPYKFNPSRFLDGPERKKECPPVNFGMGKRSCTGEILTFLLEFIFVSTIVHKFKLSSPEKISSDISLQNRELNVCFESRTHN